MAPAPPGLEKHHPKISPACTALNPNEGREGDKGGHKGSVSVPPPCTGLGPTAWLLMRVQILQTLAASQPWHRGAGHPRAGQDRPWGQDGAGVPAVSQGSAEQRAGDMGGLAALDSPRTFAAGQGPGIGRGCWRRVTSWAAACLWCLRSVSAGSLSVPPRLSAAGSTAGHQPPPCEPRVPRQGPGTRTVPLPTLGRGAGGPALPAPPRTDR